MSTETEQPRWRRYFWRNTASNYIRTIVRLVLGLILFRLLFSGLSEAEFGFWALLWSLFGYGVLLDFGFGFTAQKAVAEKTTNGDWDELSSMLSTMFWSFVGLAVLLALFFWSIREPFLQALEVPQENYKSYQTAYVIFFGGLALTFPFGLFPEILQGLQRLDLANWLRTAGVILNFGAIGIALYLGWSFPIIVMLSIITTLLPNVAAAFVALAMLPRLSLSPSLFRWKAVRPQIGFSITAYLITFSNLLMAKSDQAVLGFTLGVGVVAVYQAGYKVAEMLNLFTLQLQDALSPAAASLRATGDESGLRSLLLKTSRLTFLITTPLYLLCTVYLEPLIRLLTGLESVSFEMFWVGQILLLAIFSSQLTNSCAKRILMMCGYELRLLKLSLIDAGANLILSIILALKIGIIGVAIGTLVPTILVGWIAVLPLAFRYLQIRPSRYFRYLLAETQPLLLCALSLAVVALACPLESGDFWGLVWRGTVTAGPAFIWIAARLRRGL